MVIPGATAKWTGKVLTGARIAGGADRPKPLHFPEKAVALLFCEQIELMNI